MRLSQVSNSFVAHDAISNDMRGIRKVLAASIGSADSAAPSQLTEHHIVCNSVTADLLPEVLTTSQYDHQVGLPGDVEDVLLHHHSIGNGPLHHWLVSRHERLVLKYHNITPSKYFVDDAPRVAEQLDDGRRELTELAARSVGAIADSEFNRSELTSLGMPADRVRVVAPFLDPKLFAGSAPYRAEERGPRLLYVGQLFPHKRVELLMAVYAVIVAQIDPTVTLDIVGSTRIGVFGTAIRSLRQRWAIPGVTFHDQLSSAELSQLFDRASMCVTMSEHEGFCVPAVESMARGVPFLCRDLAALPGTVGAGGIVAPADLGVFELAELVAGLLADPELRQAWSGEGRRRAERFNPARTGLDFLEALGGLI